MHKNLQYSIYLFNTITQKYYYLYYIFNLLIRNINIKAFICCLECNIVRKSYNDIYEVYFPLQIIAQHLIRFYFIP